MNLMPILDLFRTARQNLRHPAVKLPTADEHLTLRVSPAKDISRNAGCLYVTSAGKWDERIYYGKITQQGIFQAVRPREHRMTNDQFHYTVNLIKETLQEFAYDPANFAKVTGQKYNYCCFCGLLLTQKDSVAVGYGPICADNWGLPHAGMAKTIEREKDEADALNDVKDLMQEPDTTDSETDTLKDTYDKDVSIDAAASYLHDKMQSHWNKYSKRLDFYPAQARDITNGR
jgi:hypothetical protein